MVGRRLSQQQWPLFRYRQHGFRGLAALCPHRRTVLRSHRSLLGRERQPHALGAGSLFFASKPRTAIQLSAESSRTTHGATTCLDACRYFAGLLIGALQGVAKEALLSPRYSPVPHLWEQEPLCPEIDKVAAGSFKRKTPLEVFGSGYVVESLEAALWAFNRSSNFREGSLLAVNLGYDADTTAAIFGQLAGAYYGVDGIPREWRQCLAHGDLIRRLANDLFEKRP